MVAPRPPVRVQDVERVPAGLHALERGLLRGVPVRLRALLAEPRHEPALRVLPPPLQAALARLLLDQRMQEGHAELALAVRNSGAHF